MPEGLSTASLEQGQQVESGVKDKNPEQPNQEELSARKEVVKQNILDMIKDKLDMKGVVDMNVVIGPDRDLVKGDKEFEDQVMKTITDSLFDESTAGVEAAKMMGEDRFQELSNKYGSKDVALGMMALQLENLSSYGLHNVSVELAKKVDDFKAEKMLYCFDNSVLARQHSDLFKQANYLASSMDSRGETDSAHKFISRIIEDFEKGLDDSGSVLGREKITYETALGLQRDYEKKLKNK